MTLLYILIATILISSVSLVSIVFLVSKKNLLERMVFILVGLSTGTLLGGAFFHLLPESLEGGNTTQVFTLLLASFSLFFVIEKLLHWRHSHSGDGPSISLGYMNLLGDAIHNFIDGLIVATAFSVNVKFGIITSFALASHEIPQELGDFGVLTYSGFSKKKALLFNFLSALTAVLGGIVGFIFVGTSDQIVNFLLPIAAGSFLYISASDLIPELKEEKDPKKSFISFVLFIAGLALMAFLAGFE